MENNLITYSDLVQDIRILIMQKLYEEKSYDVLVCLGYTSRLLYDDLLILHSRNVIRGEDLVNSIVTRRSKNIATFFMIECHIKPSCLFNSALIHSQMPLSEYLSPQLMINQQLCLLNNAFISVEVYGIICQTPLRSIAKSIGRSNNVKLFAQYGCNFSYTTMFKVLKTIAKFNCVRLYEKIHDGPYAFLTLIIHPLHPHYSVYYGVFLALIYKYGSIELLSFILTYSSSYSGRRIHHSIFFGELVPILLKTDGKLLNIVEDIFNYDQLLDFHDKALTSDNTILADKVKNILTVRARISL